MVRSAAVLALASLLSFGCVRPLVRARGTPQEPVIVSFDIEGVRAVSKDALIDKLATQETSRWPGNPVYRLDPDALAVDRRRVEAFYRERGYYQARVTDVRVVPADRGRAKVTMVVSEGAPVRVSRITINGIDAAPEARQRLGRLPLKAGAIFTESAYDATRNAIQGALRSNGWAMSEVTQHATVLPDAGTAEVVYDVSAGDRWKFGAIFVAGTSAVPRDRIREQVLGALRPGDWFDDAKLPTAQGRVFDLGVFGGVRVTRGQPDASSHTIPVVVAVREAPFRTIRYGPGIEFTVIRWDVHGLFGWQHRNFFGELRRLATDVRLGYAWLPSPFRSVKQGTVGLLGVEFSQPGAITRYVDSSVRLELEKGLEQAYDFYSERVRVGFPLRIVRRLALIPSYNVEVYQVSNYGGVEFNPNEPATGGAPQLPNCTPGGVCLLSYLEQRIAWDGRDNPVNTRRGYYLAFALQEGFDIAAYGYQYLRFLPEVRVFRPMGPRTVLAARARVGALIPLHEQGEPPIVARFMAGGPLSMRGYYTNRLAKMVLQNGEWVPLGGNGLADASLELRIDVTRTLGVAIFLDAGNTSDSSAVPSTWQAALDPSLLQFASGAGIRYRTPFGPLRLDVGVRLPDLNGGGFPSVPYTVYPDGFPHSEPIVAVHLSIGEAF